MSLCDYDSDNQEEGEEVNDPTTCPISNAGHPLFTAFNPVVASTLFEFLKLTEIRNLRLVCKEWHSLSLPTWRRKVQVNIYAHATEYCNDNPGQLNWNLKSFENQLDVAREQPFRNFRLHLSLFLTSTSEPYSKWAFFPYSTYPAQLKGAYRNMEQFWANYGHWIHKLELKKVYVSNVAAFKRAIFEQTPNLQELTLNQVSYGNGKDIIDDPPQAPADEDEGPGPVQPNLNLSAFAMKSYSKLPCGWRSFFSHFPNLQKLDLEDSVDDLVKCVENMLRSPARRPNLPITDLRLQFVGPAACALKKLLRNPDVKLKVLHLRLSDDLSLLETAMQLHGNTLTELRLQNRVDSVDFRPPQADPYPALTVLEVKGSALSSNFHFLNAFPNLEVLRLEQEVGNGLLVNTNWSCVQRMPRLREFYFFVTCSDSGEEDLSEEILERFGEIMPNLDSFTGHLTNRTLRVVCRVWRKLNKLVILYPSRLYGFDPTQYNPGFLMDIDNVGITGIVPGSDERVPCVADLQDLRHLTLEQVDLIGSASVYNGFLKLPHLSYLNICGASMIHWEALDVLEGHLRGGLTIIPRVGLEHDY